MSLRCFIYVIFFLNALSGHAASAETLIKINRPIQLSSGSVADIEEIRDLARQANELDALDASSVSLKLQFVSDQIIDQIRESCGEDDAFIELFENHGFLPYTLSEEETLFLGRCMYGIFEFLDENLDFPAPGFYRRFDHTYIRDGIQLGYRCGYRTQRLFSYFALSIWLNHHHDVQQDGRFRCLGDLRPPNTYSELSLIFGVQRISDEILFFQRVFENWDDALRYKSYINLIRENKRHAVCEDIILHPQDDPTIQNSLLTDNQCSYPANTIIWRR